MDKKMKLVAGVVAVLVVGLAAVGVVKYKNDTVPIDNPNPAVTSNQGAPQSQESVTPSPTGQGVPQTNDAGGQQPKAGGGQPPSTSGGQPGAGRGGPGGGPLESVASVLGITTDELWTKLKAGTTLESIASGKGMTLEQLKEKVIAKEKTSLDAQVAQGKLTSAQAQEMLTRMQNMDLSKLGTEPEMGDGGPSGKPPQPPSAGQKQGSS